ncbi:MAG: SDR family oxidoreductase [Pseudomonadota bacterium]
MAELLGRTALVTGGAAGLGRAIAAKLADAGAAIVVLDLPKALATAELPDDWQTIAQDLTADDAEPNMTRHIAALDRLDILVANAGVVPPWRSVADLDFTEWDRVFSLNARGIALSLKCSARRLAENGGGSAVLMASINAYRSLAGQALYTASKHAILGLTRAAAQDLGGQAVRVNALAPGPILTDALRARVRARALDRGDDGEAEIEALASQAALGQLATEEDVAEAALFLAGPRSSSITGVCLPIEAGLA